MKSPANKARTVLHNKMMHVSVFLVMMMSFALGSANAVAANPEPDEYRIASAGDKFTGTRLYAFAFNFQLPRRLRAKHLELAFGSFSTSAEDRVFVSFGPVWRLPVEHRSLFIELGVSPTLISGSTLNGRDLGGNFHFTSSFAVGVSYGRRHAFSLSLRAQHTSNGGLDDTNPGIDMLGLNVAFNFTNR